MGDFMTIHLHGLSARLILHGSRRSPALLSFAWGVASLSTATTTAWMRVWTRPPANLTPLRSSCEHSTRVRCKKVCSAPARQHAVRHGAQQAQGVHAFGSLAPSADYRAWCARWRTPSASSPETATTQTQPCQPVAHENSSCARAHQEVGDRVFRSARSHLDCVAVLVDDHSRLLCLRPLVQLRHKGGSPLPHHHRHLSSAFGSLSLRQASILHSNSQALSFFLQPSMCYPSKTGTLIGSSHEYMVHER